jgi:hypothetical protein
MRFITSVVLTIVLFASVFAQDDVHGLIKAVFDAQSDKLIQDLEKHALQTKMPDIHKKIETFLADFALDFKKIKISKISLHKPNVNDKVTIIKMNGCTLDINLDWMYKQCKLRTLYLVNIASILAQCRGFWNSWNSHNI